MSERSHWVLPLTILSFWICISQSAVNYNITISYDLKYALVDLQTSWWNARSLCHQLFDQDLASIHNEEDNYEAFSVCASRNCWIGATNIYTQTPLITEWMDGSAAIYQYMSPQNEPVGCLKYANSPYWTIADCLSLPYQQLSFICNQNPTLSPTNSPSLSPSLHPTSAPTTNPSNVCTYI